MKAFYLPEVCDCRRQGALSSDVRRVPGVMVHLEKGGKNPQLQLAFKDSPARQFSTGQGGKEYFHTALVARVATSKALLSSPEIF